MKAPELKWSKEQLVKEIERLRDREDALEKIVQEQHVREETLVAERANTRTVLNEQLAEIERQKARADEADTKRLSVIMRNQYVEENNPLSWKQIVELVGAVGGSK